jgi:hypothetical protein
MLVVGCVAGFFVGRLSDATESAILQAKSSAAIANLRRSIEEEVSGLRDEVHAAEAKPGRLEQASRDPGDLDRLTAAVEKLNGLVETGAIGGGPARPPRAGEPIGKGAGYPSLEAMWLRIGPLAYKAESQAIGEVCDELGKAHFLWSRADVFERYGSPSSVIAVPGGLQMNYESVTTPGSVIHVRTSDGLVTGVDFTPRIIVR